MCGRYIFFKKIEEIDEFLNPDNKEFPYLNVFFLPFPDDVMAEHIVPEAVGNVRNNSEVLIQKGEMLV